MPKRNRKLEERINVATHGLGTLLSVMALLSMLYVLDMGHGRAALGSVLLFGGGLIALYAASTIYHAMTRLRYKRMFQTVDHLCIYLLIAGTYTPIALLGLKGSWGWGIFTAIWILAALGFVYKLTPLKRHHKFSLALYLGMGWLVVVALFPLIQSLAAPALAFLGLGGFFYTAGTYFFARDHKPYYHCIWHVFVLLGSASHFAAVYLYLL